MDHFAGEDEAAPAPASINNNIYMWDLVTHQPPEDGNHLGSLGGRGVVTVRNAFRYHISAPVTGARFLKLLRVDCGLVNVKPGAVTVVDRSCMLPGMPVGSASDLGGGQIGVVTGATTLLDLVRLDDDRYVPTAPVIRGVPTLTPGLRRVRRLNLGDFVVSGSGPWLGRVVELSVDVDVLLGDGTIRRFADAESKKQILRAPERSYTGNYRGETGRFYPGQHVDSNPSAVLNPYRFRNGVVVKVEVSGVLVHWVASPHCGTDKDLVMASSPPAYQCPHDLTYFCSPSHPWTVADRCFLGEQLLEVKSPAVAATASSMPSTVVETKKKKKKKNKKKERRRLDQYEMPMSVCNTHTTVDVLWQDGTRQRGVPSTSLVPLAITISNQFLPGEFVVDNAPLPTTTVVPEATTATKEVAGDHDDDDSTTRRRVGIVRSLNFKDQTVRVSWLKAASSSLPHGHGDADGSLGEVECGHDTDTVVSAYDLQRNPEFALRPFYGDVVVRRRLPSLVPNDGGTASTTPDQPADLSWVGRVIDLPDGKVLVRWGDGSTSTVLHHEVCVVVEDHYMNLLADMGEWVEVDDDDDGRVDAPPREMAGAGAGAAVLAGGGLSLSGAVRSVISLAGQVLAGGSRYLATWLPSSAPASATSELPAVPGSTDQDEIINNNKKEEKASTDSTAFPRFDVVAHTPPDHHYLDSIEMQSGNGGGKKWVKAVQKEWKILENNLPDTIYVRAYEDRMDLLRAVMVGASGTPYHDGLFFFDMQLPASYPAAPPQVYYHSHGLQINPNLYPSGTVCLSLLNTFGGRGTEVWSPEASTLLQVLVSIQGLVLNDDPYYNEAGYEALVGKPESRRNALSYGENAYLLSLRTALHVLRRPPRGFEEFVKDHFRHRGKFIIRACEACVQEGCAVGTLTDDADTDTAGEGSMERRQCSTGLKLALTNMLPSLVAAFE